MYSTSLKTTMFILIVFVQTFSWINVSAQVNMVTFVEVTNTNGEGKTLNTNNRGDNPFNNIRAKLFVNSWVTEEIGVFLKFLYDEGDPGSSYGKLRIDAAYFFLTPKEFLNIKFGKIASSLGNFSERNYLERNPLIGTPLLYSHKTNLGAGNVYTKSHLIENRGTRYGVNIIYEACWNDGVELSGSKDKFDYKFSVTDGSLSNPISNTNSGFQVLGRLGFIPVTGMKMGFGYANAPYLVDGAEGVSSAGSVKLLDYRSSIMSADLEYSTGFVEIYAEWAGASFDVNEADLSKSSVSLNSYFVEGKYKLTPRVYASGRFGQVLFEDVASGVGAGKESWDYDVSRIELGLGYKLSRKTVVKAVWQKTFYENDLMKAKNFVAFQLKTEL